MRDIWRECVSERGRGEGEREGENWTGLDGMVCFLLLLCSSSSSIYLSIYLPIYPSIHLSISSYRGSEEWNPRTIKADQRRAQNVKSAAEQAQSLFSMKLRSIYFTLPYMRDKVSLFWFLFLYFVFCIFGPGGGDCPRVLGTYGRKKVYFTLLSFPFPPVRMYQQ